MDDNESVWEYFGENDPYFGVNSIAEMRSDKLDDVARNVFFKSGEDYIDRIWNEIEDNFERGFKPDRALDFGCGVARITLPIAKRSGAVVGVDISTGMLELARKNAAEFNIENTTFIKGDDELSNVPGKFDLVHSFVVFQHIEPKKGERIFTRIVEMLDEGGIGVLHVEYANTVSTPIQKLRFWAYRDLPLVYRFRNLLLGKRKEPLIPMYLYDLNRLLLILQQNDCHKVQVRFSKHGVDGVVLIFKKEKSELY
ncbi:MAG: class I SAM-dependent methyltransferase [Chloracidobacterium sp.]|nr:class I SAM-dependent methyltransferase [Chloracidobacterium sp.]